MVRNHRTRFFLLVEVILLLVWLLAPSTYQAKDLAQSGEVSRSDLILAMNTLRVSRGLPRLIEDPIINAVAQATAETMAANNMSWHIGDVRGRIQAAGYGGGGKVWATENFAVGWNSSIDEIMQAWADPEHMRPAVNPAYCHVGAGIAEAADGRVYYILQAAYTSNKACGEYKPAPGDDPGGGEIPNPPVSQIIIPVKIATPDTDGRIFHTVQSGQSFWSIAIAYQITINDLEIWNNLSRENGLVVGQELFIPSSKTEGYATPTPIGMVVKATPDVQGRIIHEVQPYQALIKIADAYIVTLEKILSLNGLQADWPLQIGQKLLIDPGHITPSPTPRPLTPIEQLTPSSDGNYYHIVKSGEYLAWIADLYEIKMADLMSWNNLSSTSVLQPGQELLLRVTPPATETPIPVLPSSTPTPTSSPIPPTSTQELATQLPNATRTSEPQTQPGVSGLAPTLGIVFVVASLFLLGWLLRRR
ncbi:MAG: LysM peptidoglycan-binding domain-containing protein [Chloroflexota bacterium]|nr:MAG: LysM peptidoglycan-binding domain-containing protein [Chloroflexota bacterium]